MRIRSRSNRGRSRSPRTQLTPYSGGRNSSAPYTRSPSYARRAVNSGLRFAAGQALRYAGVPPAMADAGITAARRLFTSRSRSRPGRAVAAAPRGTGKIHTGSYGGKFKKSKKVSDPWKGYSNKGFVNTYECHGLVADPDCVYLGHSAMSIIMAYEVVGYALIRKILEKVGRLNITDVREKIQGYLGFDSDAFKLELITVDSTSGATVSDTHTFALTESVRNIIGDNNAALAPSWTGFQTAFLVYMRGSAPNTEPTLLRLWRKDGNAGAFWVNAGELDLKNEMVHFKAISTIKIQNRSLSSGGGAQADDVDNNPLVGFRYGFSGGVPITRATQGSSGSRTYLFDAINHVSGVMLVRAAQFGTLGSVFKEPASPGVFTNIVNSNKVRLDPGQVKQSSISYVKTMSYLKFMKALADQVTNDKVINIPGKFELFALEDVINVNSSQNIKLAYEVDRKSACYLTTKKRTHALGDFGSATFSNEP